MGIYAKIKMTKRLKLEFFVAYIKFNSLVFVIKEVCSHVLAFSSCFDTREYIAGLTNS